MGTRHLYIELYTLQTGAEVFSLLNLTRTLFDNDVFSVKIEHHAMGHKRTLKSLTFDLAIQHLRTLKSNELEIKYKKNQSNNADQVEIEPCRQHLYVSPFNTFWAATTEWSQEQSRHVGNQYWTAKSFESFLRTHDLSAYPSILTSTFQVDDNTSWSQQSHEIIQVLAQMLDGKSFPSDLMGGGGIEVFNPQTGAVEHSIDPLKWILTHWPRAAPSVGEKFPRINSVNIGGYSLCLELSSVLGSDVEIVPWHTQEGRKMAVLFIPDNYLTDPLIAEITKPYKIPLNDTTLGITPLSDPRVYSIVWKLHKSHFL